MDIDDYRDPRRAQRARGLVPNAATSPVGPRSGPGLGIKSVALRLRWGRCWGLTLATSWGHGVRRAFSETPIAVLPLLLVLSDRVCLASADVSGANRRGCAPRASGNAADSRIDRCVAFERFDRPGGPRYGGG